MLENNKLQFKVAMNLLLDNRSACQSLHKAISIFTEINESQMHLFHFIIQNYH